MRDLIKESNAIEGITDPAEVEQSLVAWAYLMEKTSLNHSTICAVQKIITLHQDELQPNQRGYYRGVAGNNVNVRVGSYYPPPHTLVPSLMENWLLDYKELTPWANHVRFEKIHPFADGNGRTGRMLLWWQEIGAGLEPEIIRADERFKYYARLSDGR
jgi:Fic family protein